MFNEILLSLVDTIPNGEPLAIGEFNMPNEPDTNGSDMGTWREWARLVISSMNSHDNMLSRIESKIDNVSKCLDDESDGLRKEIVENSVKIARLETQMKTQIFIWSSIIAGGISFLFALVHFIITVVIKK